MTRCCIECGREGSIGFVWVTYKPPWLVACADRKACERRKAKAAA